MKFLPRALAKWPAIGPTAGKKSLPKREPAQLGQAPAKGQASFAADVLGPRRPRAAAQDSQEEELNMPNAQAASDEQESYVPPQPADVHKDPCPTAKAAEEADGHDWLNLGGRWTCKACMCTNRAAFPPTGRCPGLTPALADIVRHPRKHVLQIAPMTDGSGIVIMCSRCGHFAASNRRNTKLHTKDCTGAFGSEGAKYAYKRFCDRQHPTYSRGPAKVLETAFSAASLGARCLDTAPGATNPPQASP